MRTNQNVQPYTSVHEALWKWLSAQTLPALVGSSVPMGTYAAQRESISPNLMGRVCITVYACVPAMGSPCHAVQQCTCNVLPVIGSYKSDGIELTRTG